MGRATVAIACAVSACGFNPHAGPGDGGGGGGDGGAPRDIIDDGHGSGSGSGAYRKAIAIHGAMVTGTQSHFPVWIDLTDPDIAARATSDGHDIFFTGSDGTALAYELERWDPANQRLLAWVGMPTLAHGPDTTIYVEYGDPAKAVAPDPQGVFQSSFVAVWHLDDSLSSTMIAESTGTHAGTAMGLGPADQVTGKLGGGIAFDGTGNAMIAFTAPVSGNSAHTISAWVSQATTTHTSAIVVMGSASTDQSRFLYGYAGNTNGTGVGTGLYSDDWYPGGQDIEAAGWTMLTWTFEGPNKKNHLFKNGVEVPPAGGTMSNGMAATAGSTGLIGYAPEGAYGSDNGMFGTIDELRVATVARDATWIATEYANQSAPGSFYAVGPEQQAP